MTSDKMKRFTAGVGLRICKQITGDEEKCNLLFNQYESGEMDTDTYYQELDNLIDEYKEKRRAEEDASEPEPTEQEE